MTLKAQREHPKIWTSGKDIESLLHYNLSSKIFSAVFILACPNQTPWLNYGEFSFHIYKTKLKTHQAVEVPDRIVEER